MALTVTEKWDGRKPAAGDKPADELTYLIIATAGENEGDALVALLETAPDPWNGLTRKQCRISETLYVGQYYVGTASYESADKEKKTDESSFTFDTTGGTAHITQAKKGTPIHAYAPSGRTPTAYGGAIGVTEDSVDGTDVTVPAFAFTITKHVAADDMSEDYIRDLFRLTGSVNGDFVQVDADGVVIGFQSGELLFKGARGSKRGRGDWEIGLEFAGSPNVTDLEIGDMTGIEKRGWDYLWVRYRKKEKGTGADKVVVMDPVNVTVDQVYDYKDFSPLQLDS